MGFSDRFFNIAHGFVSASKGKELADSVFPGVAEAKAIQAYKNQTKAALDAYAEWQSANGVSTPSNEVLNSGLLNLGDGVTPPPVNPGMAQGVSRFNTDTLGMPKPVVTFKPSIGVNGLSFSQSETPESKAARDLWLAGKKQEVKKDTDLDAKVNESKMTSRINLGLVTENLYDLNSLMADAYREGGAGSKLRAMGTEAASAGYLPMSMAGKYAKSSAIPGKRVEIVSKMMPMLTQQIGKAGSVRLVESIFDKLGGSIPDLHTPPELAKEQASASVLSMYRVLRSMEKVDISKYKLKTDAGKKSFVDDISEIARSIELSPEEQSTYDVLSKKVAEPLDRYMAERNQGQVGLAKSVLEELRGK